jgi:hypothetical protein
MSLHLIAHYHHKLQHLHITKNKTTMKNPFRIFASHHKNVSQAFENSSHSTSSSNSTSTSFFKTNLTSQALTKLVVSKHPIHAHHLANLTNIN